MTYHYEYFNENSYLLHPEKNIQPIIPHTYIFDEDNYNEEKICDLNSEWSIFSPKQTNEESGDNSGNLLSQDENNEEKDYSLISYDNTFFPNLNNENSENNLNNSFESVLDINWQNKEKIKRLNNNNLKNESQKFRTTKKRGRKTKKLSQKFHDSSSVDNCLLKIQNNFFNFIIKLTNEVLNKENIKEEFIPVDYKIKRNVTHKFFCELKKKTIKNILEMDNSPKYKSKKYDFNKKTLNKIYNYSNWLNDYFNINYLELFFKYHNNEKPLIKFFFKGKEIELTKTKSFYYLLNNKNNKGKKIEKDLSNIAKRFFIDDNLTFNKILFKPKKIIDLKE